MLKFGIHPYLQDIIDCAGQLLSLDKDAQVRRAALYVFIRMVKSMGIEVTELLPEHLEQMIALLQKVEFYDKDSLIKHNAYELLQEIEQLKNERLRPNFL